ncbi:V/A-type H+-transporting ATPase subunit F [Anaerosphaera aminiphila DSM 21120]|uniref:V-type ATP synthase subunit F n=1 Tax=Anaerosphaera aminiphila DSM 21120 TaxID=1120995 RepID=A0A1M5UAK0_9FIRM|nr:V-type ATP synthase subunit F [Anaerosphaera aminiphila]SHH60075.1 V/A-type H+-transporting ATPase subunit F [Anaerosphaera aminiphila DSM 21120]
MYKIAVIGDKDSVSIFKVLGIDVVISYEADDARNKIDKLAKDDYGVIFITEELASKVEETIERYNRQVIPAIILIPSNQGTLNMAMDKINENVEKAVGSNIL